MKSYKHLFFDLDHTLWDFDTNSKQTFVEIFDLFKLEEKGITDLDLFFKKYKIHNENLWELYRKNEIEKEQLRYVRFIHVLHDFGIKNDDLAGKISDYYIYECPRKKVTFPGVHETLSALSKKYTMSIITNGFNEVQSVKMNSANLEQYFNHVVTSEDAGAKKPHPTIFQFALAKSSSEASNSIMVGDHMEADIKGAFESGIDQVHFNPDSNRHNFKPSFEIKEFKELGGILLRKA